MEIIFTEQFERAYEKMIKTEKKSVHKALSLLGDDPKYPSLHEKKWKAGRIYGKLALQRD